MTALRPSTRRSDRAIPRILAVLIAAAWLALLAGYAVAVELASAARPLVATIVLLFAGLASSVIWLNGIRHLVMWLTGPIWSRMAARNEPRRASRQDEARVALLYCTRDDFNAAALRRSMAQQHRVTTLILDDSADSANQGIIDDFAEEAGCRVVRRHRRTGFKAGNLNNALGAILDDFDYFVVLDSDEVIPPDFVTRALSWFAGDPQIGIVQANHRAWRGETAFTAAFSGMLGSHISVAQPARSHGGFSAFMGRGAMISADCYRAAGPIPELVIEDVAFSLEARIAGFTIAFDRELVCMEDYPIDYHAFRSQHVKLVEGTTEFLRRSWRRILSSPLRPSEKADLLFEQTMVPLLGFSGLVLILSSIVLTAFGGGPLHQPLWTVLATGFFAAAPLLPETVRVARRRGLFRALGFLALASALYSSTLLVTLRASWKVLLGQRATFRVTPKSVRRFGRWWETLVALRFELGAAGVATVVVFAVNGTLMAALPIAGPVLAAVGFASLGARSLIPADDSDDAASLAIGHGTTRWDR
ncbi:MAG: Cellulose synthase/poly-beta,6-N-acetylglucosamine synthase-like glycosyltransferase [Microbacteriaceae bacterium]|nr:Cellulose synthase/poly-beta,6-N-acetylglucosamine synthase-like glycosyltransferase [Microbacteriaceae bacterium]